jgi:tetratricopeptide (TPR) repeat protein
VLEVLVELGALGVIAFLWMVVAPLIGVARLARDDTGGALRAQAGALAAGWLAVFLQSLLDVGMRFWSVPVLFWAGLGMMIAAQRLLREPETHAEPRPVESAPKVRPEAVAGMVCIVAALVVGEFLLAVNGFRSAVAAAVMKAKPETVTPAQREERLREALDWTFFYLDRLREHEALGRTLASRGAFGAARDEFKTVMRLAGDYHDVELMLASTYLAGNNLMEAMQHLIHYAQLRPSDPKTAQLLVQFRRKKTPAEAMKEAEELIRRYPDFGKVYVAAGLIALDMDPPDQRAADENFEKALRLNLADAHAAYLLGMQKLKKEDYGNALRLLSGSLEMGFRSPALYVNLARLQEMFGHGAEARELLKDGQRIYPDDEAIRKALGEKRAGAD